MEVTPTKELIVIKESVNRRDFRFWSTVGLEFVTNLPLVLLRVRLDTSLFLSDDLPLIGLKTSSFQLTTDSSLE
jgi:hypothetical protein